MQIRVWMLEDTQAGDKIKVAANVSSQWTFTQGQFTIAYSYLSNREAPIIKGEIFNFTIKTYFRSKSRKYHVTLQTCMNSQLRVYYAIHSFPAQRMRARPCPASHIGTFLSTLWTIANARRTFDLIYTVS